MDVIYIFLHYLYRIETRGVTRNSSQWGQNLKIFDKFEIYIVYKFYFSGVKMLTLCIYFDENMRRVGSIDPTHYMLASGYAPY